MIDFYHLLGVNSDSSIIEIKKAHKKLVLKFHPDTNSGDKFFEDHFKKIQEAYEVLSDKQKRSEYDSKFFAYRQENNNVKFEEEIKKKYEEEFKRKYEEELIKKEREIKKKYQTPEQRAAEDAEDKKRHQLNIIQKKITKLKDEITIYNNQIVEKKEYIDKMNLQIKNAEAFISETIKKIEKNLAQLNYINGDLENMNVEIVFVLEKHQDVVTILNNIKIQIKKDDQEAFIKMFMNYAKSNAIPTFLKEKNPNLLELIIDNKYDNYPFKQIYLEIKDNENIVCAFEKEVFLYFR
jgi:curved DNA-binding protein CbpA